MKIQARQNAKSLRDIIASIHNLHEKRLTKKAIALTKKYAKKYDSNPENPSALMKLKNEISCSVLYSDLFDIQKYTRDFEARLMMIFERFRLQKPFIDLGQ